MNLSILASLGSVALTVGGIIIGKYYTERGSIKLYETLATALDGIRDTQTSMPQGLPEAESVHEEFDDTPPRRTPPNVDPQVDEGPSITPALLTVATGLRADITRIKEANKTDFFAGFILIAFGIGLIISSTL